MRIKLTRWGPAKLRKILEEIEDRLNENRPIQGLGIQTKQEDDGVYISTAAAQKAQDEEKTGATGGTTSGTVADIYGALNGQPALFHLFQSSPPTPVT